MINKPVVYIKKNRINPEEMHLMFSEVMWFEEPGVDYNAQVNITIANISFKYNLSMVDNQTLFLKF